MIACRLHNYVQNLLKSLKRLNIYKSRKVTFSNVPLKGGQSFYHSTCLGNF